MILPYYIWLVGRQHVFLIVVARVSAFITEGRDICQTEFSRLIVGLKISFETR